MKGYFVPDSCIASIALENFGKFISLSAKFFRRNWKSKLGTCGGNLQMILFPKDIFCHLENFTSCQSLSWEWLEQKNYKLDRGCSVLNWFLDLSIIEKSELKFVISVVLNAYAQFV